MKKTLTLLSLLPALLLNAEHVLFQRDFRSADDLIGIEKIKRDNTAVVPIDGSNALRFTVPANAEKPRNTATIPLRGAEIRNRRITVTADVKLELSAPEKRWEGGWFALWAGGEKGTKTVWKRNVLGSGKTDWKTVTLTCDIPDTVTRGYLEIGIVGSRGTILFRNPDYNRLILSFRRKPYRVFSRSFC